MSGSLKVFGEAYVRAGKHKRPKRPIKRLDPTEWVWKPFDISRLSRMDESSAWPYACHTNYRPSRSRRRVVLVFDCGALSRGLVGWLKRLKLEYFYLSFEQFIERGVIQMSLAPGFSSGLSFGSARLRFDDVAAVIWFPPSLEFRVSPIPSLDELLYAKRWSQVIRDLRGLLPARTLWLPSHPLNGSQEWQNRLSEYRWAIKAGLAVPPTVCTNDRSAALAFMAENGGRVLFREFSMTPFSIPPAFVDVRTPGGSLRDLGRSPCVFQKYIDKEFDVRAVAIGDRIFACRIDSQASESAKLDWRVYDDARVKWERMELPKGTERAMLRLMGMLGLSWGSFDLVKGKDGTFYFIEVNRPGASYWLLPYVGLDVAKEVAAYVKHKVDPS